MYVCFALGAVVGKTVLIQEPRCLCLYILPDGIMDLTPVTTFAHLDATTILSYSIADLGIYPAVEPLDFKSQVFDQSLIFVAIAPKQLTTVVNVGLLAIAKYQI
jgi:hypothetical protein